MANPKTIKLTTPDGKTHTVKPGSAAEKKYRDIINAGTTTKAPTAQPSQSTAGRSVVGNYKGVPIYSGNDAEIQRQMASIDQGGTQATAPSGAKKPVNYAGSTLMEEQFQDPKKKAAFDALPEDLQAIYTQTMRSLEKSIESGKVVNPNIEITPAQNRKLLAQAETELDPYYKERLGFLKNDFETSVSRLTEDYGKIAERRKDPFKETLEATAESEAQAGTAFSSGRNDRERRLVMDEQQSLDDLTTQATRAANDSAKSLERNIGSGALRSLNIPGINTYQATNTGIETSGSRQLYDPTTGNALGDLNKERTTAIEGRRSELEDTLRRNRNLDLSALS